MMKKIAYLLFLICLFSCTSNTIFKEPEDLIPKDTMSLLIQEMMIASSSEFIKNKNLETNINYMPFVYQKFKIDSARFEKSNFYYISKIDDYQKIMEDAKKNLEKTKEALEKAKARLDSIEKDSIQKTKILLTEKDTIVKLEVD